MGFVDRQAPWTREDSRPFQNDPRLTKPTRIKRVGKGFFAAGRDVQPGEVVVVDATTASDLCFLGKAELVEG